MIDVTHLLHTPAGWSYPNGNIEVYYGDQGNPINLFTAPVTPDT